MIAVFADSEEDALTMAQRHGRERQVSYAATDGTFLSWEFHAVQSVHRIDTPIVDGMELCSRHLRHREALSLLTPFDD